jgi:hypothetical protein
MAGSKDSSDVSANNII